MSIGAHALTIPSHFQVVEEGLIKIQDIEKRREPLVKIIAQAESDLKELMFFKDTPGQALAIHKLGMLINMMKVELTRV